MFRIDLFWTISFKNSFCLVDYFLILTLYVKLKASGENILQHISTFHFIKKVYSIKKKKKTLLITLAGFLTYISRIKK
jgi:hypothetical protein